MRSLLLRLLFYFFRAFRPAPRNSTQRVLLFLQYRVPLGCCVHGTPLYAEAKAKWPAATVVVSTMGLGAATLAHDPNVDHILATSDPMQSTWKVAGEIRRQLRALKLVPTQIFQDASNRAGSLALLSAQLCLAPTIGFANAPSLYDEHIDYDPRLSLIDNNLRLLQAPHREPAVFFTAEDHAFADSVLPKSKCRVAFAMQGSGGQSTSWHRERFAELIAALEARGSASIFLGTAADAENIATTALLARSSGLSLAGRTSIPQLAAVLCECDLLISVDTGTMHVGRAVGLPLVVLGPSWQKPTEWLPLQSESARTLRGADTASTPANYRLDEIQVQEVLTAANELLELYPPSTESRAQRSIGRTSSARASSARA